MNCPECNRSNNQTALFCRDCGSRLQPDAQNLPPTVIEEFAEVGPPPSNDLFLGTTIDGRYRIDNKLGSGGMGVIYRARRLRIGDDVAIKILHADQVVVPDAAERFRREAQSAARLKHPNAVSVYDFGVTDGGLFYLVMGLVEGESIRDVIKQHGPFAPRLAAEVIEQVCAALDEAHRHQIIHRDIKPDNIMMKTSVEGLRVKVLDFGIAKLRDQSASSLTQTGSVMGTPHYMSPEQCMGEDLDHRSDIYSLGVVLYEMLAGVVPFNSPTSTAVVVQHVNQAPPSLRAHNLSIPVPVERVVMQALEKRREARPQTASEFARTLTAATQFAGSDMNEEARVRPTLAISDSFFPPVTPEPLVRGDTPFSSSQPFNTAAPVMSGARKEHNVRGKNTVLIIILSVVVIGSIAAITYLLLGRQRKDTSVVPDHYGIFVTDRDTLTELRRQEFRSVIQARDSLVGDSSLPRVGPKPVLVVFAEGSDIPLADLKLVQLDSIDPSGRLSHWNYQVAPMSGNPGMKQIKIASGLMSGKYAFSLLTGYMDEGTHKLWPFQVNDNAPSPTDVPQVAMIPLKPKPLPTPRSVVVASAPVTPPPGARIAYCTDNNVVLRSSPSLSGAKVSGLSKGQRLFVLQMSSNYDTWRGITANWAYVQPENSSVRGWVFTYFVRQ